MTEPLLRIDGLSVVFRTSQRDEPAVRDVSFDVAPGETVALVGESGSGKSTTASAINRLLPGNGRITSGSISFDGRDLTALRAGEMRALRGREIGLVPQDPMSNLDPLMRVGDQIAEALEVHEIATGRVAARRAVELLDAVGIPEPERRARQHPHQLSGGMRQRVLVAIGLACRPRLLIADEPTSALDVTVQRRVLDLIDELTSDFGTAVVLITHDLALAAERARRVVVMRRGEVVERGESARVLAEPEHAYTQRLLAAAPSLASASRVSIRSDAGTARQATPRTLLTMRDVVRTYPPDFRAVDGVSLDIVAGHTVALVGESGSGKSTTANLALALDTPTAGTITFDGADVAAMRRRELFAFRRRVQPVFQNPYASLDPRYTVERSVAEPLRVHGVGTASERRGRVVELLDRVALPPTLTSRYPHELSGGQRQRVAIARALALSPELIVLDEPVSALDVIVQAQIIDLLVDLQQERGLSYLFISHDLAVVRLMSHVVHVMRHGRIVESGAPDDLFRAPAHEYTRELLAAIPGSAVSRG